MEVISAHSLTGNTLILKRRIYNAWYTFDSQRMEGQHFNLCFFELIRKYLKEVFMGKFYDKDTMIRIAAILYLIFHSPEEA